MQRVDLKDMTLKYDLPYSRRTLLLLHSFHFTCFRVVAFSMAGIYIIYINIYLFIYINIYLFIYINIHLFIYINIYLYIYIFIIYMYTHTYIYIYIYIYMKTSKNYFKNDALLFI